MIYKATIMDTSNIKDIKIRMYLPKDNVLETNMIFQSLTKEEVKRLSSLINNYICNQNREDLSKMTELLDKEFNNISHSYKRNIFRKPIEVLYEEVFDTEGNLYGREILTGCLFPLSSDKSIVSRIYGFEKVKKVTNEIPRTYNKVIIEKEREVLGTSFTLVVSKSFNHNAYAKIETVLDNREPASKNDLERYKRVFNPSKIQYESKRNVEIKEIEFPTSEPNYLKLTL